MNIAHVVVTDAYAGAEAHAARLARAQAASGHHVVLVGGAAAAMRDAAGAHVTTLPGRTVREALGSLRRLVRPPDVVHAHLTAAETAATAYGPVLTGRVPLVVTRHIALPRGQSTLGGVAARVIRRRVAAQIAISSYVAASVDGASVVVHPGVDPEPDAPTSDARRRIVLVAQRLEAEKATDTALRTFAASRLADDGWKLHVAGEGALRDTLERLAADLGIDGATSFLGRRTDVPDLQRSASVLLAPCPVEGFGLSVLEAMSRGLPVVAARAGGHLDLLDGLGPDALVEPGDADDAARALRALALDPAARDAYGRAAQERQRTAFTLDAQVRGTEAVYRGVL
ncbi:MAG TPA: glycosyltransferase family 4 protein [Luteimicrobium sp.]|nr:glycosyltransferase family 4 protein [Luteimicrobium sp.]